MKAKRIFAFFAIIGCSTLLTFLSSVFRYDTSINVEMDMANSMFKQKVVETIDEPKKVNVLYYKNQLVGVVSDEKKLNTMLDKVYQERYQDKYPNAKLALSDDIHYTSEYSLEVYENKDEQIFDYINNKNLFSIETFEITFSNGSVMYVNNLEDYEKAKNEYILYYVDEKTYKNIMKEYPIKLRDEFGSVVTQFHFEEKAQINKGFANEKEILKNKEEIVNWFLRGYDRSKLIYTVEDGDTVQGVASKSGLEVTNLISTNQGVLLEENQLLQAGTKLDVKGIRSPVNLKIIKEATNRVTIYPDNTEYIEDTTLALGVEKIVQEERLGYRKVVMEEIYNNGVMVDSKELSSKTIELPQKKVIRIGSKKSDDGQGIGDLTNIAVGSFRFPVENPSKTCGWMCYSGHEAMDVQNAYNKYGEVIAADSGIVIVNDYHPVNGNWIEIDHQNGFVTYYGHMNVKGFIEVGERVEKGQVIGQIGMTGLATGPHVHFEVHYKGEKVDPAMYLK